MTTEPTEPTFVASVLTCHTDGCSNADQPISMSMPEGGAAACGVCGQPITDITQEGTQDD